MEQRIAKMEWYASHRWDRCAIGVLTGVIGVMVALLVILLNGGLSGGEGTEVSLDPDELEIRMEPGVTQREIVLNNSGNSSIDWDLTIGHEVLFHEDFEDGDLLGWTNGSGSYNRTVDNTTAANGSNMSLMMTGGSGEHGNGIEIDLPSIRPTSIGFFLYAGPASNADGYFSLRDGDDHIFINFFAQDTGYFYLNGGGIDFAYEEGTWYHIQFLNINWSTSRFDFWIDNDLVKENIRSSYSSPGPLRELFLYNYHDSSVRYDDILFLSQRNPLADHVTADNDTGMLEAGNHTAISLRVNVSRFDPGVYQIPLLIGTSGGYERIFTVPLTLIIHTPDHDITVQSLTLPPPENVTAGENITITSRIENHGSQNETELRVRLLIDGEEIENDTIPSLEHGTGVNVTFLWAPPLEGDYEIMVTVNRISGENNTGDNFISEVREVIGEPEIRLGASPINASSERGEIAEFTLSIGNDGLGTLTYELGIDTFYFRETFQDSTLNTSRWSRTENTPEINDDAVDPRYGPNSLNMDGDDDIVESVEFDLSQFSRGGIHFLHQQGGTKDEPDPGDFLYLEIRHPNDTWHPLLEIEGTGIHDDTWYGGNADLPQEAFHERFKFRFRSSGNGLGSDHFYIDQVMFSCNEWTADLVSFDNGNGSIAPNASTSISISVNTTRFEVGTHELTLVIISNDHKKTRSDILLNLTVDPVDHEMKLARLTHPDIWEAGGSVNITSRVLNQGNMDETDVAVHFRVDGEVVEDRTIGYIESGMGSNLTFEWTPPIAGNYTIEIIIVPVDGETITYNNCLNGTIHAIAEPGISIDPLIMNITIEQGCQVNRTITIENTGLADLEFELEGPGISGALNFNGVNGYVRLPDEDGQWLPEKDFTVEFWLYFNDDPASDANDIFFDLNFCDSGTSSREAGMTMRRGKTTGNIQFSLTLEGNPDEVLETSEPVSVREWHHFAFVRNGTYMGIFIDGNESASRACPDKDIDWNGASIYDDDSVNIGRHSDAYHSPGQYMNAIMDEARILDHGLNETEIIRDFQLRDRYEPRDGTLAWWHFDENEGTILVDSSGYGMNGTIHNLEWVRGIENCNVDPDWVRYTVPDGIPVMDMHGTIQPHGIANVTMNLDTRYAVPGLYSGSIRVRSNDPENPITDVAVNLTVLTPFRDLALEILTAPPEWIAGEVFPINVLVHNRGLVNETSIVVQLMIDGKTRSETNVSSLGAGKSVEEWVNWTPRTGGVFNLTVRVVPKDGENITWNNEQTNVTRIMAYPEIRISPDTITETLKVGSSKTVNLTVENVGYADLDLSLLDLEGSDHSDIHVLITGASLGSGGGQMNPNFPVQVEDLGFAVTYSDTFPDDISDYDVIVLAGSNDNPESRVDTFVAEGGGLIILESTVYNNYFDMSAESNPVNSVSGWVTRSGAEVIDTDHPIAHGLEITSGVRGYSTNPTMKGGTHQVVVWDDGVEFAVTDQYGLGTIVYINDLWSWYSSDAPWAGCGEDLFDWGPTLMKNSIIYTAGQNPRVPDWITASPMNATINASGSRTLEVRIDASRLSPGEVNGTIRIISNDPSHAMIGIPVHLVVDRADHDLHLMNVTGSATGEAGENVTVGGFLENRGMMNETDVLISLLVEGPSMGKNGSIVANTTIPSLPSTAIVPVELTWVPMIAGIYELSLVVEPVPGEKVIHDNLGNVTLDISGTPNVWIFPESLELTGKVGEPVNFSMTIGNNGTAPLNFSLRPVHERIYEDFGDLELDRGLWWGVGGSPVISGGGWSEPSEPYALNLNGSGDSITSRLFDLSGSREGSLSFWYQRGGDLEPPDPEDTLTLSYFSHLIGEWTSMITIHGTGETETMFHKVSVNLPIGAFHQEFRFRFESVGTGPKYDDFYLDDIVLDLFNDGPVISFGSEPNGTISPYSDAKVFMSAEQPLDEPGLSKFNLTLITNDPEEPWITIPIELLLLPQEHDLSVLPLVVQEFHQVGTNHTIGVLIRNQGLWNETDVKVNFRVNGSLVDQVVIPGLVCGEEIEVNGSWYAGSLGDHQIEILVIPVEWENRTGNNRWQGVVKVDALPAIDTDPDSIFITIPKNVPVGRNISLTNSGSSVLKWELLNGEELFLEERFDAGALNNWSDFENYIVYTGIEGSQERPGTSLYMNGGANGQCDGIRRDIPLSRPRYVSFHINPGPEYLIDTFFVLGGNVTIGIESSVLYCYADGDGRLVVSGNSDVPYIENIWYHIEFRNINWESETYDYYVNGTLIESGLPFQRGDLDGISTINLYHLSRSSGWWDDIIVGGAYEYLEPWVEPQMVHGTIEAGHSMVLPLILNGSDLSPGMHETIIILGTNDPRMPTIQIPVTARINEPPMTFISRITPTIPLVNGPVSFEVLVFDSDGWVVNSIWTSSEDGELGTTMNLTVDSLSPGYHDITFQVQDNEGAWSDPEVISIFVNSPPDTWITKDIISPNRIGNTILLRGMASDVDGTIEEVRWSSSIDGVICTNYNGEITNLSMGNHVISFQALDDRGSWSSGTNIPLSIGDYPTASIDSISPKMSNEGEGVIFRGSAHNTVGEIMRYRWRSSLMEQEIGNESSFALYQLPPGSHMIYLDVLTEFGFWSPMVYQMIIINERPMAVILNETPEFAPFGNDVTLVGMGTDNDGNISEHLWESDIQGMLGKENTITLNTLMPGIHTISFTVRDDRDCWSETCTGILRISTPPVPVIDRVSLDQSNGSTILVLSGHGEAMDPINAWQWQSDLEGVIATGSNVSIGDLTPGDHTISFRVRDELGVWSSWVVHPDTIVIESPKVISETDERQTPIQVWIILVITLLMIVGAAFPRFNSMIREEMRDPKERLLKLRKEFEIAGLEYDRAKFRHCLNMLTIMRFRTSWGDVRALEGDMNGTLNLFATCNDLIWDLRSLTKKADEQGIVYEPMLVEKAEELFRLRRLEDMKWAVAAAINMLRGKLGIGQGYGNRSETDSEPGDDFRPPEERDPEDEGFISTGVFALEGNSDGT